MEKYRQVINQYFKTYGEPSVSVGIYAGGKTYFYSCGKTKALGGKRVDENTIYPIVFCGQQKTASALRMKLAYLKWGTGDWSG